MKIFDLILGFVMSKIVYGFAILIMLDIVILAYALLAVATGHSIPHVPFWDTQMRLVVRAAESINHK